MDNLFDANGNQPPKAHVTVDISKTNDLVCEKCNERFFNIVYMFKKLSALVSPTGKETLIPIEVFACINCGTVAKELLPKGNNGISSNII